jgi:hypothetical protein
VQLREETAHPDQAHNSKVHPLKSRKNPTQKLHIKERISQARTAINYTSSFFSLDSGLKTFLTAPSHLPFFPMAPNSSSRRKNQSLARKKQRPIRSAAQTKLPPRSISIHPRHGCRNEKASAHTQRRTQLRFTAAGTTKNHNLPAEAR